MNLRPAHWEIAVTALGAVLGVWLVRPALGLAALAALLALGVGVLVWRTGRAVPLLAVPLVALAGATTALRTSWEVRAVENRWTDRREALINAARDRLDETLGTAVNLARELADAAEHAARSPRPRAFDMLERAAASSGPEHGALVLDEDGVAWAWAGRQRVDPGLGPAELSARISPFYVVLEARRQAGPFVGIGQVLLAADSAVPDPDRTVAARFARETGASLEFYAPGTAPASSDVFDYYIPADGGTDDEPAAVTSDTLFSVRAVPPAQGPFKLQLVAEGGRRVALFLSALLVLLLVTGGRTARWLALLLVGTLCVLTPLGRYLGFGSLFSSATYFRAELWPLAASAGSLSITASVAVIVLVQFAGKGFRLGRRIGALLAALLIFSAPFAMGFLAMGITPPGGDDISVGLWLGWATTLTIASALVLLVAALLIPGRRRRKSPGWTLWVGVLWAGGAAVLGLFVWHPETTWPAWYPIVWVPAILFAVLPAARWRTLSAMAATAGAAAALLTWSAVVNGRLLLAERDVMRLAGGDPVAIGMLERFGTALQGLSVPRSGASLYAYWRRSPLGQENYPAVLATWAPDGRQLARLDLAELELRPALFQTVASDARGSDAPVTEKVVHTPGVLYLMAVPFPDGSVVTVAVGPRSRLIEPVRLARFLRGERRAYNPYELALGEPMAELGVHSRIVWRRDGWTVRGSRTLELTLGPRHLHVEVALDGLGHHLVRGVLVVFVGALFVGLVWMVGEAMGGKRLIPTRLGTQLRLRSYRGRLTIALAGFFILPTLAFSAWTVGRLRSDTTRSVDLVVQQTLSDAASTARRFESLPAGALQERLAELSGGLDADLLWYERGVLTHTSPSVLLELGLLNRVMPVEVYQAFALRDQLTVNADVQVGGQATRVGYRTVGGTGADLVLAAPRLVELRQILSDQEDVLYGMALTALLGLAAAAALAAGAARSLAKPVQSLSGAAMAVGRGVALPAFDPDMPAEFVPVVRAFERMARDVEASQAALEAARHRTVSVLRNVATGVVALDRNMRVTLANPRAEELLGAALPAGTPIAQLGAADWTPVWDWVRSFVERPADTDAEEFSVDERRIRVQVAAVHGAPGGVVAALDDTTELTRAVRVIAWGELARQIAHEIKNPLTPIRLGIQHLQRVRSDPRGDFDSVLDRTAQRILAEIERLDAIARAFARFGAPPAEAAPLAAADLMHIARDAAELYSLGDGPTVEVVGDEAVALVRKDEVKEVLVNLIENARDAGASAVRIGVNGGANESLSAIIELSDDGRGIPASDLPHIFEPRFSTTTSGTGLGLAICKRLVESWGGSIAVESEVGRGTVVRITVDRQRDGEGGP